MNKPTFEAAIVCLRRLYSDRASFRFHAVAAGLPEKSVPSGLSHAEFLLRGLEELEKVGKIPALLLMAASSWPEDLELRGVVADLAKIHNHPRRMDLDLWTRLAPSKQERLVKFWELVGARETQRSRSPYRVFVAFSSPDGEYLLQLETHLSSLVKQGRIEVWHDRRMVAGGDREAQIELQLALADLVLLLVSPDFLASDGCRKIVDKAMSDQMAGRVRVIPVLLRPTDWEDTKFAGLCHLPEGEEPVSRWRHRDSAYISIVQGIRRVLELEP
jgi:hypothetical protein